MTLGSTRLADIVRGKKALVVVHAYKELDPFDRRKLHDAIKKGDGSKENIEEIVSYLKKSGAIDWTHERAKEFSSHARTCLTALPENTVQKLVWRFVYSWRSGTSRAGLTGQRFPSFGFRLGSGSGYLQGDEVSSALWSGHFSTRVVGCTGIQ